LSLQESGRLRIESIQDAQQYLEIYKKIQVPDPHKAYLIQWCEKKFAQSTENLRIYIAYIDNIPLAGGIFIDQ